MRWWKRVRMLVRGARFEAELEEEIRLHRELAGEAAFGSVALTLEQSREVWGLAWLESWKQDLRYALRGFRRSPGFALGVVGAIGLGIGLNTTAFTVLNAYALRPFAVMDPYALYRFTWHTKSGNWHNFTRAQFEDVRRRETGFSDVLASMGTWLQVNGHTTVGQFVSPNYFGMLGVGMAMGRPLLPQDDGAEVVLSYDAWRNSLAADPEIIGRKLYLQGAPFEVVGVVGPAFVGLEDMPTAVWLPLGATRLILDGPDPLASDKAAWLGLIGRLRPGFGPEGAKTALLPWVRGFAPEATGVSMASRATTIVLTPEVVLGMIPLFTAFGLVLLIACANVSNMMLARALARQREVAIRVSLGASRGRLIRQLLTESVLLAVPAAMAGFAISEMTLAGAKRLMFATMPASFAQMMAVADLSPDWRVFAFILGAAIATALLFGLVPAVQTTRSRLVEANRGDFSSDYRPARLRNFLVVAQVATCALLLITTAVVLRSESRLIAQPVGIDTRGVWGLEAIARHRKAVAERLPGRTGVEVVTTAEHAPLLGGSRIVAIPSGRSERMTVRDNFVSAEYFEAFRIPVLRGRLFTREEAANEAPLAVVSQSTARRFWPGRDPLGETIALPRPTGPDAGFTPLPPFATARVIGVVGDVRSGMTRNNDEDTGVYFPPHEGLNGTVLVRMSGNPADQKRRLDALLDEIAPSLASVVISMDDTMALRLYGFRATSWGAGFLAGVALLLTISGIYGVMSYLVSQRTKEIGIRVALGATAWDVVRMVVRQSARLAVVGAVAGVALALAVAPVFAHLLEAIQPYDWAPYATAAAVVLAAALLASFAPARRAVGLDPVRTLRCD